MLSRATWRLLFIVAICWNLITFYIFVLPGAGPRAPTKHNATPNRKSVPSLDSVVIPSNLKVIGLVFYGRKSTVEILDCYLKRNLKVNGGFLDEVVFSINTQDATDLSYLSTLLSTSSHYSSFTPSLKYQNQRNLGQWAAVSDPEAVYVKIDDDVVFIENGTIEAVIKRLLGDQSHFGVSANVVNNPLLSWVHYRLGVSVPYLPEMTPPSSPPKPSWKASDLPSYTGPSTGPPNFNISGSTPAPFKGHRWLPVRLPRGVQPDPSLFPMSTLTYSPFGSGLKNWAAAAQIHYSFLHHLETTSLSKYKFSLWDTVNTRLSINFLAIRGSDIISSFPFPTLDDEEYLSVTRPKALGRRVVVEGSGVVVHWAFYVQYLEWTEEENGRKEDRGQLGWTDALGRYGLYARENVC